MQQGCAFLTCVQYIYILAWQGQHAIAKSVMVTCSPPPSNYLYGQVAPSRIWGRPLQTSFVSCDVDHYTASAGTGKAQLGQRDQIGHNKYLYADKQGAFFSAHFKCQSRQHCNSATKVSGISSLRSWTAAPLGEGRKTQLSLNVSCVGVSVF